MSEFVVRPFAFMRLTHDALRDGFARVRAHAAAGQIDACEAEFAGLMEVVALHARHEEEVFFPLLDDRFDGAVREAGLRDAHEREHEHQRAVTAALEAGDADALTAALEAWVPSFEAHLVDEETVMMPLTERVATTVEGRAAEVARILAVDWAALERAQLPYVVRSLATTKPYGPLRMFVSAVQAAAGDRYAELAPTIRAAVTPEQAAQLSQHGHL